MPAEITADAMRIPNGIIHHLLKLVMLSPHHGQKSPAA